ncbi:ATP-binding protein [Pseudomonas sp. DP-17]|uniref:AAA family ATPase n=1 Tax=Pseudomonas sp. DP-17 TaxID=1580486 RepID=UPI001EFA6CD0|nr:ATP-binding protein [Pseudomonas sp. DP-17]MCG8911310.1 ATP-binding protein [Pseudomonas sp. DP-17]
MKILSEFPFEDGFIPLTKNERTDGQNTFSILIGKNGVGKSRFLAEIITQYSRYFSEGALGKYYSGVERFSPNKIIALSTSPFDKFPLSKAHQKIFSRIYTYIGMRGQSNSSTNAMALVSSAAAGLLHKYIKKSRHENFYEIFNLLDLEPKLSFIFKLNIKRDLELTFDRQESLYKLDFEKTGIIWHDESGVPDDTAITELLDARSSEIYLQQNLEGKSRITQALSYVWDRLERKKDALFKLEFTYKENRNHHSTDSYLVESLITLLNYGIVRLIDLKLNKSLGKTSQELSLRRASSGEQCLMVIMLGIAGNIENNSLILIDEPEISLHPSWQEKFMDLLVRVFADYKNCQFILATHSPQIVSRLPSENCYITTMGDNNRIYLAKDYYNRSADFQLTELFDAPGAMNEYITRLAFQLLTKVKNSKSTTLADMEDLTKLKLLQLKLDQTDPNFELISTVSEVCELYAIN